MDAPAPDSVPTAEAIVAKLLRTLASRTPRNSRSQFEPLWSVVGSLLCHGSGVSHRICQHYGYDPNTRVRPLA